MRHDAEPGCLACELTEGKRPLPGGRVYETANWVAEPCIGPLPAGTLILKPFRHTTAVSDLTPDEAGELGPLLAITVSAVRDLTGADQVYVCLWSHAGWTPGHIHFVVQPAWNRDQRDYPGPGPFTQVAMFERGEHPGEREIQVFAERAREWFAARAQTAI